MSSLDERGPGLREPEPLPEMYSLQWTPNTGERRTLAWKLFLVGLPMLILLSVALFAPQAFGAAIEACGGG